MTKYAKLLIPTPLRGALQVFAFVLVLAMSWATLGLMAGGGMSARADIAPLAEALAEMSLGHADAPVVLHEYASLTCPHCAKFHTETLPRIKADFVDNGKVRIIYHDFPLDNLALAGTMLARCSGKDRYFSFLGILYGSQASWSRAENPLQALIGISRMIGLNEGDVMQCLENEELSLGIQEAKKVAAYEHDIRFTPSFRLDNGKVFGSLSYEDFKEVLEKALAKKAAQ